MKNIIYIKLIIILSINICISCERIGHWSPGLLEALPPVKFSQMPPKIINSATFEQISYKKVPSVFLYAHHHANKVPVTSLRECRIYTAEQQSFNDIPLELQKGATSWYSPSDVNIYATVAFLLNLKNPQNLCHLAYLNHITSVSIAEILEQNNISVSIKWPNDILSNGKKLCGTSFSYGPLALGCDPIPPLQILINLGINVNMNEQDCNNIDQPATSMLRETGAVYNKQDILDQVTQKIHSNFDLLLKKGSLTHFLPYINQRLAYLHDKITVDQNGELLEGKVVGLADNGNLILEQVNGIKRNISDGKIVKNPRFHDKGVAIPEENGPKILTTPVEVSGAQVLSTPHPVVLSQTLQTPVIEQASQTLSTPVHEDTSTQILFNEEDKIEQPSRNNSNWIKLKGGQGWKNQESKTIWKKDKLHKDHWDIMDLKGKKIMEVDFNGRQIWPNGPKNKNKQ